MKLRILGKSTQNGLEVSSWTRELYNTAPTNFEETRGHNNYAPLLSVFRGAQRQPGSGAGRASCVLDGLIMRHCCLHHRASSSFAAAASVHALRLHSYRTFGYFISTHCCLSVIQHTDPGALCDKELHSVEDCMVYL